MAENPRDLHAQTIEPLRPDALSGKRGEWSARQWPIVILLFGALVIAYANTYRGDEGWSDDYAQYLLHARNIVAGRPYVDTGYVYSEYASGYGPRWYPPGFPLMLSPLLARYGLNFGAFQILLTVEQLFWLIAAYLFFRRTLGDGYAALLTGMLGFSPYVLAFLREVRSDIPFAWLTLAALLFVDRMEGERSPSDRRHAIAAAGCAALAYLVREPGIVMVGALAGASILRRRLHPALFPTIAAVGVVWVALHQSFGAQGYTDQFMKFDAETFSANIRHYFLGQMRAFWAGPSLTIGGAPIPFFEIAGLPLAVLGLVGRVRQGIRTTEVFLVLYLLMVLLWPTPQALRFLYPVLPLLLLYIGLGSRVTFRAIAGVTRRPALVRAPAALAVILIVIVYGVRAVKTVRAERPIDGPLVPSAQALFEAIRAHTSADAILAFSRPRTLALFTDRRVTPFPSNAVPPAGLRVLRRTRADYAVVDHGTVPRVTGMGRMVAAYPACFERVWGQDRFQIYAFRCGQ